MLEHTPRHDDPAKSESEFSENIMIGTHSGLRVDGMEKRRRFTNDGSNGHSRHVRNGAYDGLHMYSQAGAEAFTASLITILKEAGPNKHCLGSLGKPAGSERLPGKP